ncbi:3140_t:CDS:2 [Entrophospora sp. SA101]|nr:3140_t:CDS:2 [Entrophospora sp. SA101]
MSNVNVKDKDMKIYNRVTLYLFVKMYNNINKRKKVLYINDDDSELYWKKQD